MPKYFFYIILCFLLVVQYGCSKKNNLPDLRETYSYKDTKPFGGYTAYSLLVNSFPDNWLGIKTDAFATTASWLSNDSSSLYVSISKKFYVEDRDAEALLDFVYKGNTVFIAASEIDTVLLAKLYCGHENFDWMFYLAPAVYTQASVKLINDITTASVASHQYFYFPFLNYFSKINASYGRIIGYNQKAQPNCIVFFWGKGRMFLHCDPRAFSNYFLLKDSNYQYFTQLLQVMPKKPEHVYWDDYYNKKNYQSGGSSFSTLSAIFRYPALKWAFWIALLLLLLYILFNGKRRQRIVPVVKPVQNSSIAFAEAIAGLYLKEKNNRTIADKMISFFNEYIRSRYFLNTNLANQDFLNTLSRKSGVALDKTETLYRTMQQVANSAEIDDFMLLNLNEQIQQFYKNRY
ncbi:MAG: DUF4350 domain-containing protein [Ferruginibacter sp.]